MDRLFMSIQFVKGVGPKRIKLLNRLGIETIFDFLWYIPRSYYNRNKIDRISKLKEDIKVNIKGVIIKTQHSRTARGMHIFKAVVKDDSASITAVWFNQAHIVNKIKQGQEVFLTGRVKSGYCGLELNVSEYELIANEDTDMGIIPVYNLTEGMNQKLVRSIIESILIDYSSIYPDIFDESVKSRYNLCDIAFAFRNIHFPADGESYLKARRRLAFEEMFLFKLSFKLEGKKEEMQSSYVIHSKNSKLVKEVIQELPFSLTAAQKRVLDEIIKDMESPYPMNRLLQGDVGSGKTIIAALAMAKAVAGGYQAAMMVPTEILAEQHFLSVNSLFNNKVIVACLKGSTTTVEKRMLLEALVSGEIDILVGTHALIQEGVVFKNLGLTVIDEQHRFGVRQRSAFALKGNMPDILAMTATPIPRTLALTIYGDLGTSIIDELPPGRKDIKTILIKRSFRNKAYEFVEKEVLKGRQAYIVCPLVEESEKQDLQDVLSLYEELKELFYPAIKVGMVHGRMRSQERDYIMRCFKNGEIGILVSTTVIEVGVDVRNASVMIIEHAERFGISQLHQLRGRVGRGQWQSYCFLIGDSGNEETLRRLRAVEKTSDGFQLANEDLKIRGPGDFWGVKQHGLDELKVVDLIKDRKIIEQTEQALQHVDIKDLENDKMMFYIMKKFKKSEKIALN